MRPIGRIFAAFALLTCLQATTWSCSARPPAAVAPPAQTDQQPNGQNAPAITPEPESAPLSEKLLTDPPLTDPQRRAAVDECALLAPSGAPIETIGLTDRVDSSNAPRPTNPSERLLFGQVYETLIRVDCMGRVHPGLASSWRVDEKGVPHVWFVTLRDDAVFSDGTPVTAAQVREGWIRDGRNARSPTYLSRLIVWLDVVDDRTLVVQLTTPRTDAPLALAHPDLAVAKRVADLPFPLGTRSSRLDVAGSAARASTPAELTISRDNLPPLRFVVAPGDPRDLLDANVDLLLTRDPATLDYAAALPHFQRVPLAWERTHVFVAAGRSTPAPPLSENARQTLANDAVRGEARGAQGPFWFETGQCHPWPLAGRDPKAVRTARIIYDANDGTARDLAERFVAVVKAAGPSSATFLDAILPNGPQRAVLRATGLTGEALANARSFGNDAGYLLSVATGSLDPCSDLYALVATVPSLRPGTIVPLVDTRLQAVVRRGRSGLTTEFDGAVLIDGVTDPGSR